MWLLKVFTCTNLKENHHQRPTTFILSKGNGEGENHSDICVKCWQLTICSLLSTVTLILKTTNSCTYKIKSSPLKIISSLRSLILLTRDCFSCLAQKHTWYLSIITDKVVPHFYWLFLSIDLEMEQLFTFQNVQIMFHCKNKLVIFVCQVL